MTAGERTAGSAKSPQQAQTEHQDLRAQLMALQAERARHKDDLHRLNREIAKLREDLERRNSELEVSSTELGVLRALSRRREVQPPSRTIRERRLARLKSAFGQLQYAAFAWWRYLRFRMRRDTQAEAIRQSGLFDAEWYLERNPDVAKEGLNPLFHYLEHGAWEGRDPHPLFDQAWYRTTYPDVQRQNRTPLGHFVIIGAAKGYDPNPLFHTAWYVAANNVSVERINPLRHYLEHAGEQGLNPNPLFDSAWYLRENRDAAEAGLNPLAHYIHRGVGELCDPHPAFDAEWYLEQHKHVALSGMDALEHYLTIGAVRGYRISPAGREGRKRRPARSDVRDDGAREWLEDRAPEKVEGADQSEPADGSRSIDLRRSQIVLRGRPPAAPPFTGEIGVFIHLFYDDLAEEIAASLLAIPFDSKIYISTNSEEKQETIGAAFRRFGFSPLIKVLPNRGWDIAPFLLGFPTEMANHEICLKLHGKRSRYGHANARGDAWRKHLLSGLLGNPGNVRHIVDSFSAYPELGVGMIPHWRGIRRSVNVIGQNYRYMRRLLQQVGLSISPDQRIEFPSGSMFWFRRSALQPLFDLGLSWSDFNRCRPRDLDATVAHGIERCILIFAAHAGFKWAFLPRHWGRPSRVLRGAWDAFGRRSNRAGGSVGSARGAAWRK